MNKQLDNLVRVVIIAALLILFALTYKTWQILQSDSQPQTTERTKEETPSRKNIAPQKPQDKGLNHKQQENNVLEKENLEDDTTSPASNDEKTSQSDAESTSKKKPSTTLEMGRFVVIAGAFAKTENAERMMEKLLRMGYDAEITNFSNTELKTVLAGRFHQRGKADKLVLELEEKNIDAYVINLKNRES